MISDERLGKIQHDLECWQEDYDPQYDAESHQLMGDAANAIGELLSLRKAFSVPDIGSDDFHDCRGNFEYAKYESALEGNHADIVAAAEKLVRCKGRYHSEQNYRALAQLFGVTVPDLEPLAGDGNCLTVPNGWKLVPEDADQNMIDAAYRALDAGVFPGGVYADMIANAPRPPAS